MRRLVVWGAGELGGQVAAAWVRLGGVAVGVTLTSQRHAALRAAGVEPQLGSAVEILRPGDALLLSLPGYANQEMALELLAATPPPARAVLVSSTAYYGPAYGRVDENTPGGDEARAGRVAAVERAFQSWSGSAGVIMRLGGLYRPGRGPLAALARRGQPPLKPPDKTLALIHYDDAAAATVAALQHPAPDRVYLAVTPPCPTRREFYWQACRRLGLPAPRFDEPTGRPPAQYDVTRLRRDLLAQPTHPDWREALEA